MHLSNRTTEQWQKIDSSHHLHPFTDFKELIKTGTRVIISGQGNYVIDSENNKILDMMAGLWCVNIGYGRKELAEVAYEQMQLLPYYNSFFKTATTPSIELSIQVSPSFISTVPESPTKIACVLNSIAFRS